MKSVNLWEMHRCIIQGENAVVLSFFLIILYFLCAKMASDFEKLDKVHTLFPEEIPAKMWPLPVGDLLFVGGATAGKLEKAKIRTISGSRKSPSKQPKRSTQ